MNPVVVSLPIYYSRLTLLLLHNNNQESIHKNFHFSFNRSFYYKICTSFDATYDEVALLT